MTFRYPLTNYRFLYAMLITSLSFNLVALAFLLLKRYQDGRVHNEMRPVIAKILVDGEVFFTAEVPRKFSDSDSEWALLPQLKFTSTREPRAKWQIGSSSVWQVSGNDSHSVEINMLYGGLMSLSTIELLASEATGETPYFMLNDDRPEMFPNARYVPRNEILSLKRRGWKQYK